MLQFSLFETRHSVYLSDDKFYAISIETVLALSSVDLVIDKRVSPLLP